MNKYSKYFQIMVVATFVATILTGTVSAQAISTKLLTANFESRKVVQVEIGDFHFKPGQVAPIHTHIAPAVGYVVKGMIIYQMDGGKPQILRAGDAFYEPSGPRILRFDNASATEEAIFLDFNLEQVDEPFIVFEEQPTQEIDRRTLPTVKFEGKSVDQADIYVTEIQNGEKTKMGASNPIFGVVAEGVIEIQIKGKAKQRIVVGESFSLPGGPSQSTLVNGSSEVPATVITFLLH